MRNNIITSIANVIRFGAEGTSMLRGNVAHLWHLASCAGSLPSGRLGKGSLCGLLTTLTDRIGDLDMDSYSNRREPVAVTVSGYEPATAKQKCVNPAAFQRFASLRHRRYS